MAVAIDEMHVDVQQSAAAASPPAEKPSGQEPKGFRREHEMMAERELRLKAD
jgi:hypothetical protein